MDWTNTEEIKERETEKQREREREREHWNMFEMLCELTSKDGDTINIIVLKNAP